MKNPQKLPNNLGHAPPRHISQAAAIAIPKVRVPRICPRTGSSAPVKE
ncbi:MAG: hypothetical protein IPG03_14420 [Candidatus Microthrix sp.]|nr:hypothetical protein [Candidatus Microthrix sp.]MBK6503492.1 hypothetical protein [Candidatus Microthrix sp.]